MPRSTCKNIEMQKVPLLFIVLAVGLATDAVLLDVLPGGCITLTNNAFQSTHIFMLDEIFPCDWISLTTTSFELADLLFECNDVDHAVRLCLKKRFHGRQDFKLRMELEGHVDFKDFEVNVEALEVCPEECGNLTLPKTTYRYAVNGKSIPSHDYINVSEILFSLVKDEDNVILQVCLLAKSGPRTKFKTSIMSINSTTSTQKGYLLITRQKTDRVYLGCTQLLNILPGNCAFLPHEGSQSTNVSISDRKFTCDWNKSYSKSNETDNIRFECFADGKVKTQKFQVHVEVLEKPPEKCASLELSHTTFVVFVNGIKILKNTQTNITGTLFSLLQNRNSLALEVCVGSKSGTTQFKSSYIDINHSGWVEHGYLQVIVVKTPVLSICPEECGNLTLPKTTYSYAVDGKPIPSNDYINVSEILFSLVKDEDHVILQVCLLAKSGSRTKFNTSIMSSNATALAKKGYLLITKLEKNRVLSGCTQLLNILPRNCTFLPHEGSQSTNVSISKRKFTCDWNKSYSKSNEIDNIRFECVGKERLVKVCLLERFSGNKFFNLSSNFADGKVKTKKFQVHVEVLEKPPEKCASLELSHTTFVVFVNGIKILKNTQTIISGTLFSVVKRGNSLVLDVCVGMKSGTTQFKSLLVDINHSGWVEHGYLQVIAAVETPSSSSATSILGRIMLIGIIIIGIIIMVTICILDKIRRNEGRRVSDTQNSGISETSESQLQPLNLKKSV